MRSGTARITAAIGILAGALHVSDARADADDCSGFRNIEPGAVLSLGTVRTGTPRVHFLKNASDRQHCPSSSPECREKDFVQPGERIVVSAMEGEFLCADHVTAKGLRRWGWLPRTAVTLVPEGASSRVDAWVGRWTGNPEQTISIGRTSRTGEIRLKGEASFGALESARPDREAIVSTGEIEGRTRPKGSFVAFTMGTSGTLPYDQGDEYDCRVRMRRLGPFLLVEDNSRCGGMNVSFSGLYVRKNRRP